MSMKENSYAIAKRFRLLSEEISRSSVESVLDFGSGTGSDLTAPLAEKFPQIRFFAVEPDASSREYGRKKFQHLKNLYFLEKIPSGTFDIIIASEVIEHVEQPQEMLRSFSEQLNPWGKLLLTMPNGYGPFELLTLLEVCLRWLKQSLLGKNTKKVSQAGGTLAISPHIHFFSFKDSLKILRSAGFRPYFYSGRSFLCGLLVSPLVESNEWLSIWNAEMADKVPPQLCSSWIFYCEKSSKNKASYNFSPNFYQKTKRWLNLKTAGLL